MVTIKQEIRTSGTSLMKNKLCEVVIKPSNSGEIRIFSKGADVGFEAIIDNLYDLVKELNIDHVVAVESRGYLLGAPLAYKLNAGLVIVRKPGKLPSKVERVEYGLEYGTDALEIHSDAIKDGEKVLVVDDLLATGGTVNATISLVEKLGAQVAGCLFLIELEGLSQKSQINSRIISLIKC